MQLGAGVRRTGEAAAPEACGLHAEVAPIFLHGHVGGDLARAEE